MMAEDTFIQPVITIDYRRFLQLEAAETALKENSTISGLTPEEYGEATTLLLLRALQTPEVFRNNTEFTLGGKYKAKFAKEMSEGNLHSTPIVKFSKI